MHQPHLNAVGNRLKNAEVVLTKYTSNESGRDEIYVRPFPESGGRRQVSTAGGS
jgi:hypothetical protein